MGHQSDNLNAFLQKINHFAGMLELCRKKTLARSITAMAALFPGHYHFCPKTYVLPEDLQVLWRDFKSSKKGKPKTLILKPDSGSQVHVAQRTVILKPAWAGKCSILERVTQAAQQLQHAIRLHWRQHLLNSFFPGASFASVQSCCTSTYNSCVTLENICCASGTQH